MDELNQVAEAIHENLTENEKSKIKALFKSMDKNGDGKISAKELKVHLKRQNGLKAMAESNIFSLIDRSKDGYLQFDEFKTLFYVIDSNRPVCIHCKKFIPGAFFTCWDCYWEKPAEKCYHLCIDCYNGREFDHEHTKFLDNYTLLAEMKEMLKEGSSPVTGKTKRHTMKRRGKMQKVLETLSQIAEIGGFAASVVIAVVGVSS